VRKLILAATLAATTASADAAVTYSFAGTADDGGVVSGSLTIDTDALIGGNGDTDPNLIYYRDDNDVAGSTVASNFLTVNFTSTGANPVLLSAGDITYQWLQADSSGFLQLELDWEVDNSAGTGGSSQFSLVGFDLAGTRTVGGALLPDFAHAGPVYFSVQSISGTSAAIATTGMINFSAAPEASTWAMMVLGFGAVGYAARRRARVFFAA
jgi:hypothetical protein